MGAGHGHKLHYHGHSASTGLPRTSSLATLVVFMLAVVATPRRRGTPPSPAGRPCSSSSWRPRRVPPAYLARRMVVEVPFVVFALLLPFIATGPADRVRSA